MWQATATLADGEVLWAVQLPDGRVCVYGENNNSPLDCLTVDDRGTYIGSPEWLSQLLREWVYEFRRGIDLELIQVRLLG